MPHPRETGAMDDHAADQRQQRRQRHKSRFPSPAFPNRAGGMARQRTEKERQARADDQRQRKLDADIGRNVPARNIRHPVNVACKNSVDRILEIIESSDCAQRVERSQAGPRPRPNHDHVGNDRCRGERECRTAGEREPRTGWADQRTGDDNETGITNNEYAEHPHAQRTAAEHAKQQHRLPARPRQFAADADQEV